MVAFRDLSKEEKFGRLKAIKYIGSDSNKKSLWLFRCECGNETVTIGADVIRGKTSSCECLNKEKILERITKHGLCGSAEYGIWCGIKNRCYNNHDEAYPYYGGRGIKMCDLWLNSPVDFVVDIGRRPSNRYSVERSDVNGNYCFENCYWATDEQQANNKTNHVYLEYKGERLNVAQWSKRLNIKTGTLRTRIDLGWTDEEILTIPVGIFKPGNRYYKEIEGIV